MTLHELDLANIKQMKDMTLEEIAANKELIKKFLEGETYKYLMLLSNDLHYYTIFNVNSLTSPEGVINKIINFLLKDTFIKTLGKIKYIGLTNDYVEIWIGENHFGLFPCDQFFVNI